jgi:hypothetical protein
MDSAMFTTASQDGHLCIFFGDQDKQRNAAVHEDAGALTVIRNTATSKILGLGLPLSSLWNGVSDASVAFSFDQQVDALTISLRLPRELAAATAVKITTHDLFGTAEVLVDYLHGRIVAIEILDASTLLDWDAK